MEEYNLPKPFFDNLPSDIKNKIYFDDFYYDDIYNELQKILDHKESTELNNTLLVNYFIENHLITNELFIEYLCKKNNIFSTIYSTHYIENKCSFRLLNKMQSMCQCWLMYLYH